MDLAGVDTELAGQFANRAIALKRRQGYLRLKRRAVLLPRLLHDCSSFWAVYRSRTLASPPVSDPGSITNRPDQSAMRPIRATQATPILLTKSSNRLRNMSGKSDRTCDPRLWPDRPLAVA